MSDETEAVAQEMPHQKVILWQDDASDGYQASVCLLKWHDNTRVPSIRMSAGGRVMEVPYTSKTVPIDE